MPKFMTYQRPNPVNTAAWGGKTRGNPYQPARRAPAAEPPAPNGKVELGALKKLPKSI